MAVMKVNPTRMELRRLKGRLKTAQRGHKLMKDKSDEMIRRFVVLAKENKRLRAEVEAELTTALGNFLFTTGVSSPTVIEEALMVSGKEIELTTSTTSLMGIDVPKLDITEGECAETYPYSFASVTAELDDSIETVSGLLPKMLKLAEVEKTCNMLADEIEKTRRRVNALEYVMIPNILETIKYITMKLEENERGNTTRLMKFKSIMENRDKKED